ncbi:hypothetical protein GCM10011506_47480 [Marivirga lumbricoides]|uniref:Uncharacterized protein n=1 Tax=Marivirga lumbricoides TaxID=1046115 RepID=A0A2T4DPY4_9BACT|nr:hypothetical protein C9994_09935 [Marivirga lumbricoides]GGC56285.1 hypothetical protein GCM10011506_47480 [Marivirga lumbricoides]
MNCEFLSNTEAIKVDEKATAQLAEFDLLRKKFAILTFGDKMLKCGRVEEEIKLDSIAQDHKIFPKPIKDYGNIIYQKYGLPTLHHCGGRII